MVTHCAEFLEEADQILSLDNAGNVTVRNGTSPPLLSHLNTPTDNSDRARQADRSAAVEHVNLLRKELEEETARLQHDVRLGNNSVTADVGLYKTFFRAVSQGSIVKWVFAMAAAAILEKSPGIFVGIWLDLAPGSKYWVLGLFILGGLGLVANRTAAGMFMLVVTPLISHDLHEALLHTVMRSSLPFLTAVGNGALLNRSSQDMTVISFDLPLVFQRFVYSCFLTATDTFIVARGISYAWCIVPIVLASLWTLQWFYMRTSRQVRMMQLEAMSPLYTKLNEIIAGVEHIRAFGWQEQILNQALAILDESQKCFYYMRCVHRWLSLVLDLEVGIIGTALMAVAVNWKDVTSTPYLGIALVVIMTYSGNMQDLVNDGTKADTALRAVARIQDLVETAILEETVVDEEEEKEEERVAEKDTTNNKEVATEGTQEAPAVTAVDNAVPVATPAEIAPTTPEVSAEANPVPDTATQSSINVPTTGNGMIEPAAKNLDRNWPQSGHIKFENVSARYNLSTAPQMALDDVSLTINSGQKIAITGRTGSGKSTLFLTLLNFLKYTGTIFIDGIDISKIPIHRLRAAVTTIPQEHVDIPGTVRDNILPMDILKQPGSGFVNDEAIVEVLSSLGLMEYISARGGIYRPIEKMEFSIGQKQLLSLARAMLHRLEYGSTIVLMDEATGLVDDETELIMQQAQKDAFGTCTRLVIAHRATAFPDSDFLVEFRDGAIRRKVNLHEWTIDDEIALLLRTQDGMLEMDSDTEADDDASLFQEEAGNGSMD